MRTFLREAAMRIEWTTKAVKDMRRLATRDRDRIVAKVEQYAADPTSLGNQVSMLTGSEHRRMRVGNYRVIFTLECDKIAVLVVLRVRYRRKTYD